MSGPPPPQVGLRAGTLDLGLVSVIGIASAAPAYSLAAALGLVTASAGTHMPAMLLLAFLPMAAIAVAFDQLNRTEPDCGTSFAWVTRIFGPTWGWLTGWAIIAADVVVMASLAQISAQYTLALFGQTPTGHPQAALALGTLWIVAMTWVCYRGIAFSAHLQTLLLLLELVVLLGLAALMLTSPHPGSVAPEWSWFSPRGLSLQAWMDAMGVAIFIYWGWDTAVNVNAESAHPTQTPGRAAILSTVALLAMFALLGTAALRWAGTPFLVAHQDDVLAALGAEVFGQPWDKALHVIVLTSAVAATQTTILPAARTALSMAQRGALPASLANIHPRHQIPAQATLWMGVISIAWFLALSQATSSVVAGSLQALNLLVAFYYGLSGLACAWHFRRSFVGVRGFTLQVLVPLTGGVSLFLLMAYLIASPSGAGGEADLLPVGLALGLMAVGVPIMVLQRRVQADNARA